MENVHPDLRYQPSALMAITNARKWIELVREPRDGPLDIEGTAENMGIPLEYGETYIGASGETHWRDEKSNIPTSIVLCDGRKIESQRLTMGHEMGHVFLSTVLGAPHGGPIDYSVENFCEAFGQEVVLPSAAVTGVGDAGRAEIESFQLSYGIELQDTIIQLMRNRRLPPKVQVDTRIPIVKNPLFSGKVDRVTACLDCFDSLPDGLLEGLIPDSDGLPVFDFTDQESALSFRWCRDVGSSYAFRSDKSLFLALNEHYDNLDAMTS